jgi:3-oxoacyl-[acyl-carrier protein] reductase
MKLKGKIAIVTGAGSGYGAGIARRFTEEGARVVLADVDDDRGHEAAKDLGGHYVHCNVTDAGDVEGMVAKVVAELGGFDILVNNAAITQKPARIAKTTEADIDRLLAVNVKSLYHMAVCAAVLEAGAVSSSTSHRWPRPATPG